MICRLLTVAATLVCLASSSVWAQTKPVDAALLAEGEGRWEDAIRLHRAALEIDPRLTNEWLRIADIEARLGHLSECIAALQRATETALGTASIYVRLSQAYSTAGQPTAALNAIEGALALEPESAAHLRARATLATWIADYGRARDSYRRLTALDPENMDVAISFARVSAWGGDTDEAVAQYERYLKVHPEAADAWIELAKAESWRGNYSGAVDALTAYRRRFGETKTYSQTFAAVMVGGGRPGRAEDVLMPLLAQSPNDVELNVTRTIALAMQHRRREAFSSLDTLRQIAPESRETQNAQRVVRTMLASTAEPQFSVYPIRPAAASAFHPSRQCGAGHRDTVFGGLRTHQARCPFRQRPRTDRRSDVSGV